LFLNGSCAVLLVKQLKGNQENTLFNGKKSNLGIQVMQNVISARDTFYLI